MTTLESALQPDTTAKPAPLTSLELAQLAMDAAADKKALDVMTLNVGPYLSIVDYFVIATGNTDRQCAAIVDAVEDKLRKEGRRKSPIREGDMRGSWILLDYGDIVVHVFQPQARGEYRLEKLWGEADRLRGPGEKSASYDRMVASSPNETSDSAEPSTSDDFVAADEAEDEL